MEKNDTDIKELKNFSDYEVDQRNLKRILQKVKQTLKIPPIDPKDNGYIINVGCGESPDQIALQAFNANSYTQLPIIGISVDLAYPEGVCEARRKLRHFDNVDFVGGDAAVKIPEVVAVRGKTSIIVARNPDVLYKPPKGNINPLLETRWDTVFQTVFDNLPENDPGYFIVTCKGSQEQLAAEIFMGNAGFIVANIKNPNKKMNIDALINPPPMIESDQYIVVGIKNIPDHLLKVMQQTHPGITREIIKTAHQEARAAELQLKKEIATSRSYRRVNKALEGLPKDLSIKILLGFLMRHEVDMSKEQLRLLESLNHADKRLIISFSGTEDLGNYKDLKDTRYSKGGLFKRTIQGSKRKLFVKDKQLLVGLTTYTNDENEEDLDIVRIFLPNDSQDDSLKMIEKLISLENN